jgi:gliding motility-associated-like protein
VGVSQDLSCYESDDGIIKINILGGNPPYDYQDLARGISGIVPEVGAIELHYLNAGDYYIEVQDYNQCQDSILITLSQPDEVISDFEVINPNTGVSEDLILKNDRIDVMNLSTGSSIYTWNFGDGTGDILESEPSHKYTQQGDFTISLVAEYYNDQLQTSCYDTSWKNIDVEGYDVYNVFTPNGDGVNDVYKFSDELLTSLNVDIYNRWGQQVFSFNDVNGFWDGKGYNGELLPEGVYFFTMEALGELGTSYVEEGTITLIR